jgi:hypothetical protein
MKQKATLTKMPASDSANGGAPALVADIRELILSARQNTARGVNAALVMLYWQVGQRLRTEVLKLERAEYGKEILSTTSKELMTEFGRGFSWPNLSRMMALAEEFPDSEILSTLSKELGWSHFVELLPLKKHLQRDFYAEMCRLRLLRIDGRRIG